MRTVKTERVNKRNFSIADFPETRAKKTALTFPLVKRRTFSQCIVRTEEASRVFSSVLLTLSLKSLIQSIPPRRLSEVSLCKLTPLQLYRRLAVKVEAHLKVSEPGRARSSAPCCSAPSPQRGGMTSPLQQLSDSAALYLASFL